MGSIRNDSFEEGIKDAQQNQIRLLFSKVNNILWINRFGKECNTANSSHLEINQQHKTINKIQHCWEGRTGAQRPSLLGACPSPHLRLVLAKERKADNQSHQALKNAFKPLQLWHAPVSGAFQGRMEFINHPTLICLKCALEAHVCNLPFPPLP